MTYLDYAKEIYNNIQSTDFRKMLGNVPKDYKKISEALEKNFSLSELRKVYAEEMQSTVHKYLPFYKDKFEHIMQSEEITPYLLSIPARTLLFLFWIWEKKLLIPENLLNKFTDSLYIGTFGYKMVDYGLDNKNSSSEIVLVGFFSIKLAEELLSDALGIENTSEPIRNYFLAYVEIELFEKGSRWKESPFTWNDAKRLGQKAAPLAVVFNSLFRKAGYDSKKIQELNIALTCSAAAVQLIDDLIDIKSDLTNGYETLVVNDFYKTFGTDTEVTEEKINKIMTEDRLKLIYKTGQELFESSRIILEKYDEYIFQYQLEMQNLIFNSLFEIA